MKGIQWKTTGGLVVSLHRTCFRTLTTTARTTKADKAAETWTKTEEPASLSARGPARVARRPMVAEEGDW